jgi:flavin-dependent dehydrogenase
MGDIGIIGAGTAGLQLALLLQRDRVDATRAVSQEKGAPECSGAPSSIRKQYPT